MFPRLACPACRSTLAVASGGAHCPGCAKDYSENGGILHLALGRVGDPGFESEYFASLDEVESRHYWFCWRREVILRSLRATVRDLDSRALYDIGCGTGSLLAFLEARGVPTAGACDAYREGLEICRRQVKTHLSLVDEGRLPPLGPGQTLLGLFDVLEHIDDDLGTLRFLHSVLEASGVLVITVPAHPSLFDEADTLAHHRRRYTRKDLGEKLRAAGFEIRLLTHFMAPLAPLMAVTRPIFRALGLGKGGRAAELRITPGVNGLARALLSMEGLWLRFGSLPFGTSILAVAVRPR